MSPLRSSQPLLLLQLVQPPTALLYLGVAHAGSAARRQERLEHAGVALQRAAVQVALDAAAAAELLAAAGAAGAAVEQLGQRGAGAGRLRRHLRRAEVEPAVPAGGVD